MLHSHQAASARAELQVAYTGWAVILGLLPHIIQECAECVYGTVFHIIQEYNGDITFSRKPDEYHIITD